MKRREFLKNIGKLSVLIPFLSWNKEDIDRANMLIFDKPLSERSYQVAKNTYVFGIDRAKPGSDQMVFTTLSLDDYAKVMDITSIRFWHDNERFLK
jgi:hypothetical protein